MTNSSELLVKPSWGRRLSGMEGLRGLAATTVLVGHVQIHLAHNVDLGVAGKLIAVLLHGLTLFFALSGFLLYRPFVAGVLNGQRFPDVRRFFRNRALRIFPGYLVVFTLVAFVLGAAYTEAASRTSGVAGTENSVGYMTNPLLILPNLLMVQTFFPFSIKTGLGVAWSLSVELVFYVLLPLLGIVAWKLSRRFRRRTLMIALLPPAVIFLIGTIGKVIYAATYHPVDAADAFYLAWGSNWYAVFARSFLVQGDLFVFGMVAAVVVALAEQGRLSAHAIAGTRWTSLLSGALSVGINIAVPIGEWSDTLYALAFGALILFIALPGRDQQPGRVARMLELLPFRYIGLISFSMYLWHLPVMWTLRRLGWSAPSTALGFVENCVVVFVVTGLLSTATYYLVERPAMRLKKRTDAGSAETPGPAPMSVEPATDR